MRVITANVNGVRAAARKGGFTELADADVLALQEVRSSSAQLAEVLDDAGFSDWSAVHAPAETAGRNGVAVVARTPVTDVVVGLPGFRSEGRWIEATLMPGGRPLTVVSVYVPKGQAGEPPQDHKMRFLAAMDERLGQLAVAGGDVVVAGDFNIARTELDLKAWRQRIGKSGFLPEERAFLEGWEAGGWVDLGRRLGGEGPGPYTWWSQRGRAFDNDTGWRIDYVWAAPSIVDRALRATVLRAPSWDARWSDHAPVAVDFADVP